MGLERIDIECAEVCRAVLDSVKTNTYVIRVRDDFIVVDPHPDPEIVAFLKNNGAKCVSVFLTHEHPDHTFGLPELSENFKLRIFCHSQCAIAIANKKNNRPLIMSLVLSERDRACGTNIASSFISGFPVYAFDADVTFLDEMEMCIGGINFAFLAAPGHARGGCIIKMGEECVFTGDNLIVNTPVILRFPGGNALDYERVTKPILDSIPDDVLVLPGHGPVFVMRDARR